MKQGARRPVAPWVRFIPVAVLFGFLALALWYREDQEARAAVGEPAPPFSLERYSSEGEGGLAALSDFSGRPVIVNFWTTWCLPCRDEAPVLEAFHRETGGRVVLLGVNMREPPSVVRPFVEEFHLTYPILLDRDERVSKRYRVTGVPETWFIDSHGIARLHHIGPITREQLEAGIRHTLEQERADGERLQERTQGPTSVPTPKRVEPAEGVPAPEPAKSPAEAGRAG